MATALTIERLLLKMKETQASDLHIKVGSAPIYRIASKLLHVDVGELTAEDTHQLLWPLVPESLRSRIDAEGGVDFSHQPAAGERYRCSVFRSGGALHAAIRRVNPQVPSFEDLHLPKVYEQFTSDAHDGLIIICGVTGSGKSSTLAAMLEHINVHRQCNILTIEDPVEYAFHSKQSYFSQREIGIDVPDFPTALRSAVRQDPDVMMIGELRDRETILAGIQAAETGHLVFVTLHSADTMQAFARMLEFFDAKDHHFIRTSLASSLRAVAAQRLVPTIKPDVHRVPATEVLLNNSTVAERIREGRDEELPAVITGSEQDGMHDFNSSLYRLVHEEWIDPHIAEQFAPHPGALRSRLHGIEVKADNLISKFHS
ncbi:MAG TPA: PilT/PilU family type 4a pilus ATPase [Pirellulales bacterium]|jgi:twitching motility protein PilT|nr:PilT/PilU family type 4a pilus ATPase [Pirellulales bacterium]